MMKRSLRLFVKHWCPWCVAAREWLDQRGYTYEVIDVESSASAMAEMVDLSGQRKTPTLDVEGLVLPDFGPEELEAFVAKHGIKP